MRKMVTRRRMRMITHNHDISFPQTGVLRAERFYLGKHTEEEDQMPLLRAHFTGMTPLLAGCEMKSGEIMARCY